MVSSGSSVPKRSVRRLARRASALLQEHASTIKHFSDPHMPWKGNICRSYASGLSGVAYALPAFVCPRGSWEPLLWCTQVFLSFMADYVHIGHHSVWHGVDRVYATALLVRSLVLGMLHLEPWFLLLTVPPLYCFVEGRNAKLLPTPDGWKFWHGLWHLSGGLLLMVGTWLVQQDRDGHEPFARMRMVISEALASLPEADRGAPSVLGYVSAS
jgi:hypothetical protein